MVTQKKKDITAWNHNRKIVRIMIMNGIMSKEYASLELEPYCLEVKEYGESLIITRFKDFVIDSYAQFSDKRIKTLKNQDKVLSKNYKVLKEIYEISDIEAIMHNNIIDAQNKLRLAFEESCGNIATTTVRNTIDSIIKSKEIANRMLNDKVNPLSA